MGMAKAAVVNTRLRLFLGFEILLCCKTYLLAICILWLERFSGVFYEQVESKLIDKKIYRWLKFLFK